MFLKFANSLFDTFHFPPEQVHNHLVVAHQPVLPLDLISSNAPEPMTPHDQRRRAALLADSPGKKSDESSSNQKC
jgi:hypothetical protein